MQYHYKSVNNTACDKSYSEINKTSMTFHLCTEVSTASVILTVI